MGKGRKEGESMTRHRSCLVLGGLVGLVALGPVGCEQEGPADRAGKQIDEAAEETKETVKEMTDGK
jgi:hypothetical protein